MSLKNGVLVILYTVLILFGIVYAYIFKSMITESNQALVLLTSVK